MARTFSAYQPDETRHDDRNADDTGDCDNCLTCVDARAARAFAEAADPRYPFGRCIYSDSVTCGRLNDDESMDEPCVRHGGPQ